MIRPTYLLVSIMSLLSIITAISYDDNKPTAQLSTDSKKISEEFIKHFDGGNYHELEIMPDTYPGRSPEVQHRILDHWIKTGALEETGAITESQTKEILQKFGILEEKFVGQIDELLNYLENGNIGERLVAKKMLRVRLSALQDRLIKIADTRKEKRVPSGSQVLAVELLGDLRCLDAIPVLIKNINTVFPHLTVVVSADMRFHANRSTCPSALIKIGEPAVTAIIENLQTEKLSSDDGTLRADQFAYVVKGVKGQKDGTALLERIKSETKDEQVIKNMDVMLKYMK